jgi:hypothetical protein
MGLGSGIRKKPIPDSESRIQKSKRQRIPDPDLQHWFRIRDILVQIRILGFVPLTNGSWARIQIRTNIFSDF